MTSMSSICLFLGALPSVRLSCFSTKRRNDLVEFPEPRSIIAAAHVADAAGAKCAGNHADGVTSLKWSGRRDSNSRLSAPKA